MKTFPLVLIITVLMMGFSTHEVISKELNSKTQTGYEMSKLLRSDVQNSQGEALGTIRDFIVNSDGRIEFAILSQKSSKAGHARTVAIPFDALRYETSTGQFVLNTTVEKLNAAPSFDPNDLTDPKFAEHVYRFFGLGPNWTEQGHPKGYRSDQDPFDLVG